MPPKRPERHRVGEHNRPSGWQDRQADDAADQEPSYLKLSDPEQRQTLTARWQQRLPRHEQGWNLGMPAGVEQTAAPIDVVLPLARARPRKPR